MYQAYQVYNVNQAYHKVYQALQSRLEYQVYQPFQACQVYKVNQLYQAKIATHMVSTNQNKLQQIFDND